MPRSAKSDSRIHTVAGSDEGEVKRFAVELAAKLAPAGGDEFALDTIDGAAENAEQAATAVHRTIDAVLTVPFFGGGKLVWLKSATFLGDTVTARAAAVTDAVEKFTDLINTGVPPEITLLISAPGIDKRRAFYKALTKAGTVHVFDRVDSNRGGWEDAAISLATSKARDRGLPFTPDALELLALRTGGDGRQLEVEMEKLDLYLFGSGGKVDAAIVRDLVPLSRAGVIFELGNAVAARDVPLAMRLLAQLLAQGESAVGILLVALAPTFRNLLLAKDLIERHRMGRISHFGAFSGALKRLPERALDHLPRKKDGTVNTFPLGLAAVHAHRFTMIELRALVQACLEANLKIVTTQLEPEVIFSSLIAPLARNNSRPS